MMKRIARSRQQFAMFVMGMAMAGAVAIFSGCETLQSLGDMTGGGLTTDKLTAGLREALRVGTAQTVARTSREGGYNRNPLIRIITPEPLRDMTTALRRVGLGAQVDSFEDKMNLAAEKAATEAGGVFVDAIRRMTFADAKAIFEGNDTAATEYFRRQTSAELRRRYQPIVAAQMEQVGAVNLYRELVGKYNSLPLVPKLNFQLEDYVVDEALKGLFTVLGEEEKKIRTEPAARTTELLRQVFDGK